MPSLFASWLAITLLYFFLSSFPLSASNASAFNSSRREVITVRRGVVAADDGRCSRIGRDVLREGGHAVDASVAVALCLGVVSPASSGIGGGAFMLVRLASGTVQAFDMRETAPIKASENMYTGNATLKFSGALSVAAPGELAGLHQAWKLYGRLPWKRLVKPAVRLARKGFKISRYLHMQMVKTELGIMSDEGLLNLFTSRGALMEPGHLCRNQKLAKTLQEISEHGAEAFYNGSVGLNLVKDVQKAGGILTMEDLRRYQVKLREPISADILGLKVLGMPPPSSGGAAMILVDTELDWSGFISISMIETDWSCSKYISKRFHLYLIRSCFPLHFSIQCFSKCSTVSIKWPFHVHCQQILNILAQYGFPLGVSGSLGIHREIEALKHAFAVRMALDDPNFVSVKKVVSDILSPKFAAELKKTIFDNMTFGPNHYGGRWNLIQDHGTSHISIVDSQRNAVSMTSTVNSYFGAQFLSPSTGIVLNNEMDDFSIPGANSSAGNAPPARANFIRPFKRPLSSMTPTIVLKGEHLKAVVGASGGSMIIAGTTEVFLNHFARNMDPFSSVMAPRYYHELIPNILFYENWTTVTGDHFEVPAEIRAALQKKGHILQGLAGGTICQFVVQELETSSKFGELVGVSDPRKGGYPAGF